MILSKQKKKSNGLGGSWVFTSLLLLMLVFFFLIDFALNKNNEVEMSSASVFCGAEQVEGDVFVHNGNHFEGAAAQSSHRVRTGSYSVRLTPKQAQGLKYTTTDFVKGGKYRVSVWRYAETDKGFLAVEGSSKSHFFIKERTAIAVDKEFEKVQIIFNVPDHLDTLKVYAGVDEVSGTVYFDDLEMEFLGVEDNPTHFQADELHLKLSEQSYQKFNDQKWQAIKTGVLFSGDEDKEKAEMYSIVENSKIPIKLRLKGDWTDHLSGDKWSFRITTLKGTTWNQLLTFSIQHPKTRSYLKEWLFHQMLNKEDVLSPRYDFIKVKLNEKDLGVYAFEEHFDKQLPESQQRREGPIVRLTEDLFWLGMKRQFALMPQNKGLYKNAENAFEGSDIRPYKEGKTQSSPVLAKQFEEAQTLLHQFKYQLQPASEIFDIERMAKYLAIMDVMEAYHGQFWHNLRFYYNPISSRLEPIGFDGFGEGSTHLDDQIVFGYKVDTHDIREDIIRSLFKDEAFYKAYMQQLYTFSSQDYILDFLADMEAGIDERQQYLQQEFTSYAYRKEELIERARSIHLLIEPYSEYSLTVRQQREEDELAMLNVSNTHPFPLEIHGFGATNEEIDEALSSTVFVYPNIENVVPAYTELKVPLKAKYLYYSVAGLDDVYTSPIVDWPVASQTTSRQRLSTKDIESNAVYSVNKTEVMFHKGVYDVDEDIFIPEGYKVYFESGCSLNLIKNAAFISQSPVFVMGTEAAPVKVYSEDHSGNGFTVLQTNERSKVEYAIFDNLNTLAKDGWSLTGAVTFFEADVDIKNTRFSNNHCEDGLNIVHADFVLKQSGIINTFSDGFDADFCKGKIEQVIFRDTGNDGMDFSGSLIAINNVEIYNAGDKGISVGEHANVSIGKVKVVGANTGVASKDMSTLLIDNIHLENCLKGFTAYQKKPEFGQATIKVSKYKAVRVKHLYLLDKGSILEMDGQKYTGE